MACCPIVSEWLRQHGAEHAALMHGSDAKWTKRDWLLHLDEEERILFPAMIEQLPNGADLAWQLRRDHEVFRRELDEHDEIVSTDLIAQHSQLEDAIIKRLAA